MALQPRTAALFHREKGIAGRRVEGSRARARLVSRGLQALTSLRGTGREDWLVSACMPHVMNTGRNANWIPIPDHITISIADCRQRLHPARMCATNRGLRGPPR